MNNTNQDNCQLTLVIPAYNEAESLKSYIPILIQYAENQNWFICLVNDGSKDNSSEVIQSFISHPRIKVITHKVNRGYGGAIKSGIRHVTTKYCVTVDADGQHDLNDIIRIYEMMKEKDADLIVGNRKGSKASGWYRELGKSLIRGVAKIMMPLTIYDINSGLKMYNAKLAKRYISLCPDTMAFSDIITLIFIYKRNLVLESPIKINDRTAGESTINIKTAFDTVMEIINIVTLFNPMRLFLPLSFTFLFVSVAWELPIFLKGNGVSIGALLGFITSLIFFLLGLIAEQLGNIRKMAVHENNAQTDQ